MAEALTVRQVLDLSIAYLRDRGSESPRLDAEVLTAAALGLRRLDLYLAPERPLTPAERDRARELLRRRGRGEPVAYLTGTREFHGLPFAVTPAVLIPRPETETIVDAALAWLAATGCTAPRAADAGTGSGAIACAVAARLPGARIAATDVSAAALAVAARNVAALGLSDRVAPVRCDLLSAVRGPLDLVVSNPPYVAEDETALVDRSVLDHEPALALFAGPDGLSVTRRLAVQAAARLRPGGALVVEVGTPAQAARVEALLQAMPEFAEVRALPDLARVVRGYLAVTKERG